MPSKRKSVASSQSSAKKLVGSSDSSKDANSSIENQENRANCANSKDDNSDAVGNVSETGTKEIECGQVDASKYYFWIITMDYMFYVCNRNLVHRFACC